MSFDCPQAGKRAPREQRGEATWGRFDSFDGPPRRGAKADDDFDFGDEDDDEPPPRRASRPSSGAREDKYPPQRSRAPRDDFDAEDGPPSRRSFGGDDGPPRRSFGGDDLPPRRSSDEGRFDKYATQRPRAPRNDDDFDAPRARPQRASFDGAQRSAGGRGGGPRRSY